MTIIIISSVVMFIVSIIWIWHNLGYIEKPKKIAFIIIGMIITYLITLVIYNFSKGQIVYPSEQIEKAVSNALIIIFTGLNSLILLPYIANVFDKVLEEEIEKKQAQKRLIVIVIIFVICIFIENAYLKSTQQGILNIYNEVQDAEK